MTITSGNIWIAEILFTDGSASKKRPVLILWLDTQDVIVAAVTSASPRSVTDVKNARLATKWFTSRLSRPTCKG